MDSKPVDLRVIERVTAILGSEIDHSNEGHRALVRHYVGLYDGYHQSTIKDEQAPVFIIACTSVNLLSKITGDVPLHYTKDP